MKNLITFYWNPILNVYIACNPDSISNFNSNQCNEKFTLRNPHRSKSSRFYGIIASINDVKLRQNIIIFIDVDLCDYDDKVKNSYEIQKYVRHYKYQYM